MSVRTLKVQPKASMEEVARVKLFGDWLLRIKFTYTIRNVKDLKVPQELLNNGPAEVIGKDLPSLIARSRKVFEKVPYDILPLD